MYIGTHEVCVVNEAGISASYELLQMLCGLFIALEYGIKETQVVSPRAVVRIELQKSLIALDGAV
jgi:hypothetical protein